MGRLRFNASGAASWKRPGGGKTSPRYDTNADAKRNIRLYCQSAIKRKGWPGCVTGPVKVVIEVHFKAPEKSKIRFERKADWEVDGQPWYATPYYMNTTDVDNLAKLVLDALQGLVYENDRQVVDLRVLKLASEGPSKTVITVSTIGDIA